jgi:predicted Kef-type K+ transport protein
LIILLIRLIVSIALAILVGKIVSKTKLPSILGWLLAGMLLGPHALGLINNELLNSDWYKTIINILECTVGLLIGTELIWNRIKKNWKTNHYYNIDSITGYLFCC